MSTSANPMPHMPEFIRFIPSRPGSGNRCSASLARWSGNGGRHRVLRLARPAGRRSLKRGPAHSRGEPDHNGIESLACHPERPRGRIFPGESLLGLRLVTMSARTEDPRGEAFSKESASERRGRRRLPPGSRPRVCCGTRFRDPAPEGWGIRRPEDDFRLAFEFQQAGIEQTGVAGPAVVARRWHRWSLVRDDRHWLPSRSNSPNSKMSSFARLGQVGHRPYASVGGRHASVFLRCRPVRRTNTSSRLAWRVVRCNSCLPSLSPHLAEPGSSSGVRGR
jgi:hypothetical protein